MFSGKTHIKRAPNMNKNPEKNVELYAFCIHMHIYTCFYRQFIKYRLLCVDLYVFLCVNLRIYAYLHVFLVYIVHQMTSIRRSIRIFTYKSCWVLDALLALMTSVASGDLSRLTVFLRMFGKSADFSRNLPCKMRFPINYIFTRAFTRRS